MINQQILDYIKQQLQQGISREQITNALVSNGWKATDVEQGFVAVDSGFSATPLATAQNASPSSVYYAGFWRRFAAGLIDTLVVGLIFASIIVLLLLRNGFSFYNIIESVLGLFGIAIWIIYFPFAEAQWGATIGKKIVGIKVLNANGNPVNFLRSAGRNLAKIVSSLVLMIGFIMIGFTEKKQGLHDMIASCVVVKSREVSAWKILVAVILFILVWAGIVGAFIWFFIANLHF